MGLSAIFSIIFRNRRTALLIVVQTALTLALVVNALWIMAQRIERTSRPSGVTEARIFTLRNLWIGAVNEQQPKLQVDLRNIRSASGVEDAYATDSFPLLGGGSIINISLRAEQKEPTGFATPYSVDEHALSTLGLRLVAGEWFKADDIKTGVEANATDAVIVTEPLAHALFPESSAVGQTIYIDGAMQRIKGVVGPLAIPFPEEDWNAPFSMNSVLVPRQPEESEYFYVVRTKEGAANEAVMKSLEAQLLSQDRARVLDRLKTFAEVRSEAYARDRALIVVLAVVSSLLLVITALGIFGTSNLWVISRRRDIGITRAMGARRIDVMRHFHIENLLLVGCGVLLGVFLGVAANTWTVRTFAVEQVAAWFWLIGSVAMLVLGQLGALWPALRAGAVPPAEIIRSVELGSV
jgi:putative ABC transport system permease protein